MACGRDDSARSEAITLGVEGSEESIVLGLRADTDPNPSFSERTQDDAVTNEGVRSGLGAGADPEIHEIGL